MHHDHDAMTYTVAIILAGVSIQARVYWPSWSTDLDAFLRQRESETCVRYSSGDVPRHGRLYSLDVEEPCERVSVRRMLENTVDARIDKRASWSGCCALSCV